MTNPVAPMRRQSGHYSCDQCRKSKRACDAPRLSLPDQAATDHLSLLTGRIQKPKVASCSYCAKTRKTCSMNWAWSQYQIATAVEAVSRGSFSSNTESLLPGDAERHGQDLQAKQCAEGTGEIDFQPWTFSFSTPLDDPSLQELILEASDPVHAPARFDLLPEKSPSPPTFDGGILDQLPMHGMDDAVFHSQAFDSISTSLSSGAESFFSPPPETTPSRQYDAALAGSDALAGVWQPTQFPDTISFDSSPPSNSSAQSAHGSMREPPLRSRHRRAPRQRSAQSSLSPFSADQTMFASANSGLISGNLLRIYHDVMEHNLSCWLSEVSCPYKGARGREEGLRLADWGASWSTRMLNRTVSLDRVARLTGRIQISGAEDQAASRALHSAIMAFAAQWAQGSHRQRERYSTATGDHDPLHMAEEFDRDLQRHFWDQARRAVDKVAGIDCYKAASAEIILGMSQKPWTQEELESSRYEDQQASLSADHPFNMEALSMKVAQIMSQDGPPVYLERAVRKMQALKHKSDSGASCRNGSNTRKVIPLEHERTLSLLYWQVVMLDTIASTMNERPFAVADSDCHHDSDDKDDGRWDVDLFINDHVDAPQIRPSWPCNYTDAAEAVTKSGPVKILLFRHVGYLQSARRRGQSAAKIEEIIRSAMAVRRYWNATYGAFFRELMEDFGNLPSRIRSWFFCISAHWHLASLLLADMVDVIDDEGAGCPRKGRERSAARAAPAMRASSVRELAELARLATPADVEASAESPGSGPQLPEFHHAVNEGTVLTEPWTALLLRGFSRAAALALQEADDARRSGHTDGMWDATRRARDCTRALFYLGRKSDMARRVADVLTDALNALRMAHLSDEGRAAAFAFHPQFMMPARPLDPLAHDFDHH